MNSPKTKATAAKNRADSGKKQVKATLSATDAAFLKQIADKLGITEQEVIRKGVKLMNLYAEAYDDPESKMIIETANSKQDIRVI